MAGDFVVRFADFAGGDWGQLDPGKAKPTQWRGTNICVYDSKLIGVRGGLAPLAITGLPDHPDLVSPRGFEIWNGNLIVVGEQPYRVEIGASAAAPVTAVAMTPFTDDAVGKVHMAQFHNDLYMNVDGLLFKYEQDTFVQSIIATPFPIRNLTRWNYYLVGVDIENPWRLWYSDVGEAGATPDSWGANNFLDVGSNESINALMPMYNYLYAGKASGWYAVSGVLADRPFTRRVTNGNGPISHERCSITTDNRILYWGHDRAPVWFNGESAYFDEEFRVSSVETNYPTNAVVASPFGRRCFMLGEPEDHFDEEDAVTGMLMYDDGDWTTHDFPVPFGGIAGHDLRESTTKPPSVMFFVNRGRSLTEDTIIYSYDIDLDRPGRLSDAWARPYDVDQSGLLIGTLDFPAYYDSQSRMVLARNAVIQLRHWPSEVPDDINELHCAILPMGRFEGGSLAVQPQVWVQPSDRAHQDGSDEMWRIGVGDIGWANGFQVTFPRMRGVAIRSIEVHCEVRTPRL